jgi:hypothetical protein
MYNCQDHSHNRAVISRYIQTKLHSPEGHLTPSSFLRPITTDMDIFPYDRFYRGMVDCSSPRVFDREAGHRRWSPSCYTPQFDPSVITPRKFEGCFQIPCSTILPCINADSSYKQPIPFCVNISP